MIYSCVGFVASKLGVVFAASKPGVIGGPVWTRDLVTGIVHWNQAPPTDMKPDPDYEPKVGEWFWWHWASQSRWQLHHRTVGNNVVDQTGGTCKDITDGVYRHKMLPAAPPE